MPKKQLSLHAYTNKLLPKEIRKYLPKFELVMLAVILLSIILTLKFGTAVENPSDAVASSAHLTLCTNSNNIATLEAAVKDIRTNNMPDLAQQVTTIEAIHGYKTDPNCLYPIVYYYVNTSNYPSASKYLADLKAVYKNNYSLAIGHTLYMSQLQTEVNNMQATEKTNWGNDTAAKIPVSEGDINAK